VGLLILNILKILKLDPPGFIVLKILKPIINSVWTIFQQPSKKRGLIYKKSWHWRFHALDLQWKCHPK
jgi:hypothetical protein